MEAHLNDDGDEIAIVVKANDRAEALLLALFKKSAGQKATVVRSGDKLTFYPKDAPQ